MAVSPIASLLEEVGVDEEAARYAITALWNRGVVGLLATLGPDDDGQYPPTEDLEDIRDYLDQRFSGPGRGAHRSTPGPSCATAGRRQPRRYGNGRAAPGGPSSASAAVLGIPAAVLGFGSGLDATKVGATMAQMERQAIRNGVLPDAEEIAETLTMQLNIAGVRIGLDTSAVLALQPDQEMLTRVWNLRVAGGVGSRAEARTAWKLPVTPADEVYLMPFGLVEQPVGQPMAQPAMRTRQLSRKYRTVETGRRRNSRPDAAIVVDAGQPGCRIYAAGSIRCRWPWAKWSAMCSGSTRESRANDIADAIVARVRQWQLTQFAEANAQMCRTMLTVTVGDINGALELAINIPDEGFPPGAGMGAAVAWG